MSFFSSNTYKKTILPLFIALLAFVFTLGTRELQFVQSLEFPITDAGKFAYKEKSEGEKVDTEIMILGITEASETQFVGNVFGQFPWPREVYSNFISYFDLTLPDTIKSDLIIKSLGFLPPEKLQSFGQLIETAYELRDPELGKILANLPEDQWETAKKTYQDMNQSLNKDTSIYVLKDEFKNNEEFNQKWFKVLYNMNLNEVRALTWNSLRPKSIFFDIFIDFKRNSESDQKLFDEIKKQEKNHFIFMDFFTSNDKKGRLHPTRHNLKNRYDQLKKWEIKNIYDFKGKKLLLIKETPPLSYDIKPPLLDIVKHITGFGPANILTSKDGKKRKMPLIWKVYDENIMDYPAYLPTIDMALLIDRYYDIKSSDDIAKVIQSKIKVQLGKKITLKKAIIRKRLNYVRSSFKNPNKKYRWTEFVDPVMDNIIGEIIKLANKEGKQKGQFEVPLTKLLTKLQNPHLINLIKKKYSENGLNFDQTAKSLGISSKDLLIKEIKDFLRSLSETSLSKKSDFFILNEQVVEKIDHEGLKKYYTQLKNQYDLFSKLITIDGDDNILFFGTHKGKLVYEDVTFIKQELTDSLAKESASSPSKVDQLLKLLTQNKVISLKEKDRMDFDIVKGDELKSYQSTLTDEKVKGIISLLQQWKEYNSNTNQDTTEFYSNIEGQYQADKKLTDKTIKLLVQKGFITYKLNKNIATELKIPNLFQLAQYINPNTTEAKKLNAEKKRIVRALINKVENKIKNNDGLKYYSIPLAKTLEYLSPNSELKEEQGKREGLTKVEIKTILKASEEANIMIVDNEIQFPQIQQTIEFIQQRESQVLILDLFKTNLKDQDLKEIPLNNILLHIAKDIESRANVTPQKIHAFLLDLLSKTQVEGSEKKIVEFTFIPEEKQTIRCDLKTLMSYRITTKNIVIPIDEAGQVMINFQGRAKSFESIDFGKHMRFSRGLPHPITGGDPIPFEWEKFKNKVVCVGFYTSAGLGKGRDYFETPYGNLYGIEIHTNALYTIFEQDYIRTLDEIGSFSAEVIFMFLFAVIFAITLPRLSILKGFLFFAFVVIIFIGANIVYIFPTLKIDVPIVGTGLTMIFTFISLTVYKLMTEEKEKRKIKGMFSKYVSPDLVNQLVSSGKKLELGGEDRNLTVLFSDIRGFTALSETLTPHDLVVHLNIYLSEMTDVVHQYKGTLDKYIGDALMAFWGAPLDIPDHALLGCKAAIVMMEKLDEVNAGWPPEKHIRIGIGVNTGHMVVGNMGSSSRMDYTIMGDSVNLGARVEGANKMYTTEIIITEYTYELVKDHVTVRELDLIRVKGKTQPVKIYELLAVND